MGENPSNEGVNEIGNGAVKDIANVLKNATVSSTGETVGKGVNTGNGIGESASETIGSEFKVAKTNLPEKTGFWTKVKNALLYDVTIELTPYQQKIEDEINDFLHQEVTWQSFKNFLFQEVPITYKGKRIF